MSGEFLLLVAIGLVAGVASGMFGIGGGVIIVPALVLLANFTQQAANGTSLAALLLPVGIFAVLQYYRKQLVDVRAALLIALGLVTGVYAGAQFALSLPAETLKQLYGAFLVFVAWRFIEPITWWRAYQVHRQAAPGSTPAAPAVPEKMDIHWALMLLLGIIAGVASGMFGIGGGVVIVPILVGILHFDQKMASGTSLAALLLPVGLPGVLSYLAANEMELGTAVPVALGLLFGAIAGARIAIGLPSKTVKRLYGFFLLFVAFNFIFL